MSESTMRQADPLIKLLYQYGHFDNPLLPDTWNVREEDLPNLTFKDKVVKLAVQSYQDYFREQFDDLSHREYGREAMIDGEIGPCTQALLMMERCGHPDYVSESRRKKATGSGSWPANCYDDWPGVHVIKINFNKNRMPSFLSPVFDAVIKTATDAYAQIGLKILMVDGNAHVQSSFEVLGGSTIGLAIVGRGQTCSTSMWAKFDPTYRPNNVLHTWPMLIMHEWGHNCGLSHTRGGIMNPSITPSLNPTWIGDNSYGTLKRWFGGEPVVPPHQDPEVWTQRGFKSDRGREVWFDIVPPIPASESLGSHL